MSHEKNPLNIECENFLTAHIEAGAERIPTKLKPNVEFLEIHLLLGKTRVSWKNVLILNEINTKMPMGRNSRNPRKK